MPPLDPIAAEVAKFNFPIRPPGQAGAGMRTFEVQSNNFLVTKLPAGSMYHYDVSISYLHGPPPRAPKTRDGKPVDPNEISKGKARLLIHKTQVDNPLVFTGTQGAYDGRKNLYLVYKPKMEDGGARFTVDLAPRNGQTAIQPSDQFVINLKYAASVDVARLRAFVTSGGSSTDAVARRSEHQNAATAVMFVNEVLRRTPTHSDQWITVGRTFLSKNEGRHTKLTRNGLVLIPGFFQSVRPSLSGINVTIDSAIGVMYPAVSLLDLILQFLGGRNDARMLSTGRTDFLRMPQCEDLKKFLRNLKVFPNKMSKAKKITDIVKNADDYRFNKDGEYISIREHFKRAYNISLQFPDIICVQVGENVQRPIVYPVELCMVKPGQLYRRALPPDVTREMQRLGATKPEHRLRDIQDGFRLLNLNADSRQSGIEVNASMLKVQARILPRPTLWFRNQQGKEQPLQPAEGSNYTLPGKQFMKPRELPRWGILTIYLPSDRDYRNVTGDFAGKLCRVLAGMGMNPSAPKINEVFVSGDIEAALSALAAQIGDPILIVVVLPTAAAQARHRVKFFGDVRAGIPTQCVKIDKIRGVKDDYLHNLALKINVRIGGTNHFLGADVIPWGKETAIIIGADVSHPPAGGDSSQPSVSAMCASVDGPLCEYIATSRVQTRRVESIEHFKDMMMYLIEGFRHVRLTKQAQQAETKDRLRAIWPSIMLIYRDGVGEGQYAAVSDEEMRAAREAIAAVKAKYNENAAPETRISYIIVSKKHHQRFFPSGRDADRNGNCFPGSVFDQGVAHPTLFDFWLQSQAAIKGTARPAHYIVCHDENRLNVDVLQKLSYNLCYVYARATRSVSIPAPVYYADLICGRSRFMMDPGLFESGSVMSGDLSLSLQQWQEAYRTPHGKHQRLMYYM